MVPHKITSGTVKRHFQLSAVTSILKHVNEKPSFLNQGKAKLKSSIFTEENNSWP